MKILVLIDNKKTISDRIHKIYCGIVRTTILVIPANINFRHLFSFQKIRNALNCITQSRAFMVILF